METSITTPDNPHNKVAGELITQKDRFLSYLIDTLVLAVIGFLLGIILLLLDVFGHRDYFFIVDKMSVPFSKYHLILSFVIYSVYSFFEYKYQKTLGKYFMKLKVVSIDGNKPTVWQVLLRNYMRIVPGDVVSFLRRNARGFHDQISKTWVVYDRVTASEVAEKFIKPERMVKNGTIAIIVLFILFRVVHMFANSFYENIAIKMYENDNKNDSVIVVGGVSQDPFTGVRYTSLPSWIMDSSGSLERQRTLNFSRALKMSENLAIHNSADNQTEKLKTSLFRVMLEATEYKYERIITESNHTDILNESHNLSVMSLPTGSTVVFQDTFDKKITTFVGNETDAKDTLVIYSDPIFGVRYTKQIITYIENNKQYTLELTAPSLVWEKYSPEMHQIADTLVFPREDFENPVANTVGI